MYHTFPEVRIDLTTVPKFSKMRLRPLEARAFLDPTRLYHHVACTFPPERIIKTIN